MGGLDEHLGKSIDGVPGHNLGVGRLFGLDVLDAEFCGFDGANEVGSSSISDQAANRVTECDE